MDTAGILEPAQYSGELAKLEHVWSWSQCAKEHQPTCILCQQRGEVYCTSDRYGFANTWRICLYCGLIWAEWRPTPAAYADFYRTGYRNLELALFPDNANINHATMTRQWCEVFTALIETRKAGMRLLDLGGDNGDLAQALCERFEWHGTCLDPAAANYVHISDAPGWRVDMVDDWDVLARQKFDIIICNQTVDHFAEPIEQLSRAREAIWPDGKLIITFVDHSVTSRAHKARWRTVKIDHPCNYVSHSAARVLKRAGWHIVKQQQLMPKFLVYVCSPN